VNFLNIGSSELILIIILAILLVGPKRMVELSRMLGRAIGKLRKISGEFQTIIRRELSDSGASMQQLADGSLVGQAGVEGELSATGGQIKSTVEALPEEMGLASLQAELQETERATRRFLERVSRDPGDESKRPTPTRPAGTTQRATQTDASASPEAAETETTEAAQAESEASASRSEPQETERATRKFLERASQDTDSGQGQAKASQAQAAEVGAPTSNEVVTSPAGQTDAVAEQEKADGNDLEA